MVCLLSCAEEVFKYKAFWMLMLRFNRKIMSIVFLSSTNDYTSKLSTQDWPGIGVKFQQPGYTTHQISVQKNMEPVRNWSYTTITPAVFWNYEKLYEKPPFLVVFFFFVCVCWNKKRKKTYEKSLYLRVFFFLFFFSFEVNILACDFQYCWNRSHFFHMRHNFFIMYVTSLFIVPRVGAFATWQ